MKLRLFFYDMLSNKTYLKILYVLIYMYFHKFLGLLVFCNGFRQSNDFPCKVKRTLCFYKIGSREQIKVIDKHFYQALSVDPEFIT